MKQDWRSTFGHTASAQHLHARAMVIKSRIARTSRSKILLRCRTHLWMQLQLRFGKGTARKVRWLTLLVAACIMTMFTFPARGMGLLQASVEAVPFSPKPIGGVSARSPLNVAKEILKNPASLKQSATVTDSNITQHQKNAAPDSPRPPTRKKPTRTRKDLLDAPTIVAIVAGSAVFIFLCFIHGIRKERSIAGRSIAQKTHLPPLIEAVRSIDEQAKVAERDVRKGTSSEDRERNAETVRR